MKAEPPYDLLVCGGLVVDGSGAEPRAADLAIRGDHIAALGNLDDRPAKRVIRAEGRYVCPGFIDIHSHSDVYLMVCPEATSKLHQGVTTEVVGQCGASAAPLEGAARLPADWASHTLPKPWRTVAQYRERLLQARPALNVAMLVGHNTLRAGVMGQAPRTADAGERRRMVCRLEQALDEGAAGLSSGLLYRPGRYANADEIQALTTTVARRGGLYATHLRNESEQLVEALDEALEVAGQTGVALQISHLKSSGRAHRELIETAMEHIERARDNGLDVCADRYPYTAGATELDILFPEWAAVGGREDVLQRLEDTATRRRLARSLDAELTDHARRRIMIGGTWHTQTHGLSGLRLDAAARQLGCTPGEAIVRIVRHDRLRTGAFFFSADSAAMRRVLMLPWVAVGSDASLRSPVGPLSHDHPHPRAYGAFTRFFRMTLRTGLLTPGEAVRRMTGLPAARIGLPDRGTLRAGAAADILVLDPVRIRDHATYARPHQLSEGIDVVIVNGVPAMLDGKATGARAGQFLPVIRR